MTKTHVLAAALFLAAASLTTAHIHLDYPLARGDPRNRAYGADEIDHQAPLNFEEEPEEGGPFPCKGHTRVGPSTFTARAGRSFQVRLSGKDAHAGGHCQFSVSFDNARTWAVVRTILENCLVGNDDGPYRYSIPIPDTAPNGKFLFSWTFVNKEGELEFYMNCVDGTIVDGRDRGGYVTGTEMIVLRLPGYPGLGEWKYGGDNGIWRFKRARKVTVGRGGFSRSRESTPRRLAQPGNRNGKQSSRGDPRPSSGRRNSSDYKLSRSSSRRQPSRNSRQLSRNSRQPSRNSRQHSGSKRRQPPHSRRRHSRKNDHDDDEDDDDSDDDDE